MPPPWPPLPPGPPPDNAVVEEVTSVDSLTAVWPPSVVVEVSWTLHCDLAVSTTTSLTPVTSKKDTDLPRRRGGGPYWTERAQWASSSSLFCTCQAWHMHRWDTHLWRPVDGTAAATAEATGAHVLVVAVVHHHFLQLNLPPLVLVSLLLLLLDDCAGQRGRRERWRRRGQGERDRGP